MFMAFVMPQLKISEKVLPELFFQYHYCFLLTLIPSSISPHNIPHRSHTT